MKKHTNMEGQLSLDFNTFISFASVSDGSGKKTVTSDKKEQKAETSRLSRIKGIPQILISLRKEINKDLILWLQKVEMPFFECCYRRWDYTKTFDDSYLLHEEEHYPVWRRPRDFDTQYIQCSIVKEKINFSLFWYLEKELFEMPVEIINYEMINSEMQVNIGMPKKVTKVVLDMNLMPFPGYTNGINDFEKDFPYAVEMQQNERIPKKLFYMAPQIELLYKAGYENLVFSLRTACIQRNKADITRFNQSCQQGSNMKSIFKMDKYVYKTLKGERCLSVWDSYRKMAKQGKIGKDNIERLYARNFDERSLDQVSRILNRKHNGKAVFSFTTLINYLDRIDQFEAINSWEGLQLLDDYLRCCEAINMKPRIDGDSLKREHDIAARILVYKQNEELAERMLQPCMELQKFDYSNDYFFIRGIRSYDDLLDEAKQQHNCVAGYAKGIADGNDQIFVMRRRNSPDKSLITVQLSQDKRTIWQKFLAYNKPIHNKSQSDFLSEWLKWIQKNEKSDLDRIVDVAGSKEPEELYRMQDQWYKDGKISEMAAVQTTDTQSVMMVG